MRTLASSLQNAAAAGQTTAMATIATVLATAEAAWGSSGRADEQEAGAGPVTPARRGASSKDPTSWFVADDPLDGLRYFVVMGSDNLDHWRTNVTFDPVPFREDPALSAKVRALFVDEPAMRVGRDDGQALHAVE